MLHNNIIRAQNAQKNQKTYSYVTFELCCSAVSGFWLSLWRLKGSLVSFFNTQVFDKERRVTCWAIRAVHGLSWVCIQHVDVSRLQGIYYTLCCNSYQGSDWITCVCHIVFWDKLVLIFVLTGDNCKSCSSATMICFAMYQMFVFQLVISLLPTHSSESGACRAGRPRSWIKRTMS